MSTDLQVDFSGGQVNLSARRRVDLPAVKTGGRTVSNFRVTSTSQLDYRPGRAVRHYSDAPRGDYFRVSTGEEFIIRFAPGTIAIHYVDGTMAAGMSSTAYAWGDSDVARVTWAQALDTIFICFPGMRPQLALWNRSSRTWTFDQFFFDSSGDNIKQPYYRQSVLGATMSYSATTGSVTLTCSQAFFTQNMVGLTLSVVGQQVTITAVASATSATATPAYRLPDTIKVQVVDVSPFQVGQIVSAVNQNIKFEVGYIDSGGKWVHGIMLSNMTFQVGQYNGTDTLVSPLGSSKFAAAPDAGNTNLPTIQWQEEFMNAISGWPASVSYDRGRVIFADFPQAWNAVLWSAISAPQTFWVDSVAAGAQPAAGANANAAILDLIAAGPRVRYVVGWQQGQFAFTDRGTFFIPISAQQPLIPGSVEFNRISDDGVALIRPVTIQDAILFINAGLSRVAAVRAAGSATRPFVVEDVSDAHTDLFNGKEPVQIAVATGDGDYPERYIYVVNSDGGLVVGKFSNVQGQVFVGWAPWPSVGLVHWVTAGGPRVFYTTLYTPGIYHVEEEDSDLYIDGCIPINDATGPLEPPVGKGPLWQVAGRSVTLMDGARDMGERDVDADGNIVPISGEDLTSPTIVAGFFTEAVFEPFVFAEKEDRKKRFNIGRVAANVRNATDFTLGKKVFASQRFGDSGEGDPHRLDGTFRCRMLGRQFDPTVALVKHRPGPITICEFDKGVTN